MFDSKKLVLERLMRYYRLLSEISAKDPVPTVTSARIAEALDIDPTQVRKDFGIIGLQGMGRVGYDLCEVCSAIRVVLGFNREYNAVLVGAGNLGGALLAYKGFDRGFDRYGLNILAAFDNDKSRIGTTIAGCPVKSTSGMKQFVRSHEIRIAILTIPSEVAQTYVDRLVSAGVKAIWNFTPTQLAVPPGVLMRNEHISIGLAEIAYHLKQTTEPSHQDRNGPQV